MVFPNIDEHSVSDQIILFIQKTLKKSKRKNIVIGLSGGIDSAISCALSVQAIGSHNIYPIMLPYGDKQNTDLNDALTIIEYFNIPPKNCTTINIKPIVDSFMSINCSYNVLRIGNCMARVRMIEIFDSAKANNALVMGTENRTEHMLGYFTRFGDEASDIEPIRVLYKTQIYQLAAYFHLPKRIIDKAPSAGLWDNQTDENDFGFSYKVADEIIYRYVDAQESIKKISKDFPHDTLKKVLNHIQTNKFKHFVPYVFSLTNNQ
jgi:NAD+ synthase